MMVRFVSSPDARAEAWRNAASQGERHPGSDIDLLYAMLRLAAGRTCPCTRDLLAGAVIAALRGILPEEITTTIRADAAIDDLVMSGDLIAGVLEPVSRHRLMYAGPAMFVRRPSGAVFVMGGLGESESPFDAINLYRGPFRELEPAPTDDELMALGYSPYPLDAWVESPRSRGAGRLLAELDTLLDAAAASGEVRDVEIVDPKSAPTYYVGRWTTPRRQTGRFVARRRRPWGGRAWGYVELLNGSVARYLPFPAVDARFRACDEAWWAMCAGDNLRGTPQSLNVAEFETHVRLSFLMPLPMWAERRLLTVGALALERPRGALVAYDLPRSEAADEIAYLSERLWMATTWKT